MKFHLAIALVIFICSCEDSNSETPKHAEEKKPAHAEKSGLKIETGINRGITPYGSTDIKSFLIHTTTVLVNDTTIPIHVDIGISQEISFPGECSDDNYRVFLWPDSVAESPTAYEYTTNHFYEFVDSCWDNPHRLSKTLAPGDSCHATIGALYPSPASCGVFPRVMFSTEDKQHAELCGVPEVERQPNESTISVQMAYFYEGGFGVPPDSCLVIPCGFITYPGR